ncbi:MAG TPA: hypothetical protein VFI47_23740 [Acidimicrobiales bacterium]|nr:hypothetical protein [Acidimicrobiales bacterium]
MIDRRLRARVLLGEAHALGIGLGDLIAAADTDPHDTAFELTVSSYVEAIAPTFTAGTAATYRSYWRLAAARLGDRQLTGIAIADLQAVVADAVAPGPGDGDRQRRPGIAGELHRGAPRAVQPSGGRWAGDRQSSRWAAKPRRTRSPPPRPG